MTTPKIKYSIRRIYYITASTGYDMECVEHYAPKEGETVEELIKRTLVTRKVDFSCRLEIQILREDKPE